MRPILALLALAAVAIALRIRHERYATGGVVTDDIDWLGEYGCEYRWPHNSATYLYNARTGVVSSYN